MKQILPAAAMALVVCAAQAQTYRDLGGTVVPGVVPIQPGVGPLFTPSNPGNVAGTFSASLGGFTPTPSYKQLTSSGTSSVSAAVPTGTVDIVYNTSASVAYCTYGASGVAATSSSDVIQANSWVAFTVPSGATTIACISPSGNLGINVSGGSGLPTGSGGGGGGGGGGGSNASVGSTGSSPPSSGTYLAMNVGGNLTGVPGTTNGLKVDGSGVTQPMSAASLPLPSGAATAANQPAIAATSGSAAYPANAIGFGAAGSGAAGVGVLKPLIQADTSADLYVTASTPGASIQAGSAGKSIYVTGWEFMAGGATTFELFYSTNAISTCNPVTGVIAGPWSLSLTNPGETFGGAVGSIAVVPAGDTLCYSSTGATVTVGGHVSLAQF